MSWLGPLLPPLALVPVLWGLVALAATGATVRGFENGIRTSARHGLEKEFNARLACTDSQHPAECIGDRTSQSRAARAGSAGRPDRRNPCVANAESPACRASKAARSDVAQLLDTAFATERWLSSTVATTGGPVPVEEAAKASLTVQELVRRIESEASQGAGQTDPACLRVVEPRGQRRLRDLVVQPPATPAAMNGAGAFAQIPADSSGDRASWLMQAERWATVHGLVDGLLLAATGEDRSVQDRQLRKQIFRLYQLLATLQSPLACRDAMLARKFETWIAPVGYLASPPPDFLQEMVASAQKSMERQNPVLTEHVKQHTTTQTVVRLALGGGFQAMFVRSFFMLSAVLAVIVFFLLIIGFAGIHSERAGRALLLFASLPPFAVAVGVMELVGFGARSLEWSMQGRLLLIGAVAVLAGGITFDVGRRILVLVEDERRSEVVRGLEHFGLEFSRGNLIAVSLANALDHVRLSVADILGVRRHGLESAKWLEHFVMRSVAYRALDYLATRAAYVVDNLIVLGFMFAAGGLVSDSFRRGIVKESPELLLQGATAMIAISALARFLISLGRARLFPSKGGA